VEEKARTGNDRAGKPFAAEPRNRVSGRSDLLLRRPYRVALPNRGGRGTLEVVSRPRPVQAGAVGSARGIDMTSSDVRRNSGYSSGPPLWRSGWILFAAVMMIFGGVMSILEGIAAIAHDDVLVVTHGYAYQFNVTSWGWIHLVLGCLVVLAGLSLIRGALWARLVGIFLAGLSVVANFIWLPHYPLWAIVLIAIDVFVIWALATADSHGHQTR
jgi:hypothetical protein